MRLSRMLFPMLLLVAVTTGCDSQTTKPESSAVFVGLDDEHFYQDWTRLPEDETGLEDPSNQVYRPSVSKGVSSGHFLNRYSFEPDGTCQWNARDTGSSHFMENGTWRVDTENVNVVRIDNPVGIEVVQFRVLEIDVDYLRVEPIKYELPPCNFRYGVVDAFFFADTTFDQVDAFCRGLALEYRYLHSGQVLARIEVIEGDYATLMSEIEAEDAVDEVYYVERRDPAPHDLLYINFSVQVSVDAASAYLATIPGVVIEEIRKWGASVRFDVTAGSEDDWIEEIGQESIVSSCRKVNESLCDEKH